MKHPSKNKSINRLQRALDKISELKELPSHSPQFEKWQRDTEVAISNAFGDKPKYLKDFSDIRFSPIVHFAESSEAYYQEAYVSGLESATAVIESMIDEIREYWEDDDQQISSSEAGTNSKETSNEIFVVHGRDDGAKETVARFLSKLGLEPIILHEQPNQGRTIIEKFEEYAQVGFAIVLLTPDDTGAARDECGAPQLRARQNVIFELGFFVGKLGRGNTCALLKADVEIPSDYDGVLYITMDDLETWKLQLVRELKAAGLDVDANLAL
ncbi:MAG: nucleotide-binding protein [Dehalococcoidia bacterium]|nr:nucleotide-binding protein [Dehalococcoidia bacterium]